MSQQNDLSFEKVNAHVEKYFTPELAGASIDPTKICQYYNTVKPILKLIEPTLPAKWQSALDKIMAILDTMCPSSKP
jgi:hypothetical protein